MRRLILQLAMLMITFGVGLGIDRLISRISAVTPQPIKNCEPLALPSLVETIREVTPLPPIPVTVETPNAVLDYNPKKFYPDGGYLLIDPPRGFHDFDSFSIEWSQPDDGKSGYIYTSTFKFSEYKPAIFGLVTERRVFFVSAQTGGFEYRFDGEFVRRDFEAVANTNKAVLRGTLTKTKGGRMVAERVVSFRLEYDRC